MSILYPYIVYFPSDKVSIKEFYYYYYYFKVEKSGGLTDGESSCGDADMEILAILARERRSFEISLEKKRRKAVSKSAS